jgi:hypothetical protein
MIFFHRFSTTAQPHGCQSNGPDSVGVSSSLWQKAIVGLPPDFLSRWVALWNSMRFSLKKAAHAVLAGAA